ncbi:GAF and ANTAR domain-containing protein [Streptomyces longwoodensis]|uniref:GAF and ANTAR domain-containing protein n=1 Tax=Streptomyces longwoodensis TaxID=68231 RepID=UPI002253A8B4|nr:GAF and ANTAR domain-containing protein [Streptomyces longwoodensis]MCX4994896.1 GAF and ANTAR domain-containing protein [Streptomyces longwoodensis]WRY89710.1 GAF and ANTAR domain-containing protein [Streptomyces longwoodensis]WUC58805.1 GAF and ANTAR domain-containing protein [Streptomyces longwoodensis]
MRPADGEPPEDGGGAPAEAEERRRIAAELAAAAEGLETDDDIPEALCRACVRLLPVSGASVTLSGGPGVQSTWCASDPTAARLAETQFTLGDGPGQTALERAAPVLAADLTDGPDVRRWPVFAHQAVELGVRAVFSLPLGVGDQAIGTIDLFRDTAGPLDAPALRTALRVRDALTATLLDLHARTRPPAPDHTEVHQAVGMVMTQFDADAHQALDRLRARAFAEGRTLAQLAHDVITRKLRLAPAPDETPAGGDPPDTP